MTPIEKYREKKFGHKNCIGWGEELLSPIDDLGGKGHNKPTTPTHNLINLQFTLFSFFCKSGK